MRNRSPVRRGLVAVSHPLAAEAGATILRAGGNAIDAAAAVQLALNVVEPLASGIGGGAFSLIRLANGETFVLDSRERAPAAATPDQFLGGDGEPSDLHERYRGGNAVGVPGALLGLTVALRRWGSLPLQQVLLPAIELAEGGLPVSRFMAAWLARPEYVARLAADRASAAIFLPGGQPLAEGQRLHQPDLARTFKLIAERGPDVFYRGQIAQALVAAVRAHGGRMTLDDLASYAVERREPLYGRYRDYEVATMPPPGSGLTLLGLLGLIEPFEVGGLGWQTTIRAHLELQAMRLALVDRVAHPVDPSFSPVPVGRLLDPAYLATRRSQIARGPLHGEPGVGPLRDDGDTTHFVVLDRWGNLVCCTATIEELFGSGITVPGYGFLLNNELTDFDAQPGGPNQVRPFARPASSMVPTLLLRDGQPWLALGSPGGPTIVTAVFQTILRLVDDGLTLQEAIASPRLFARRYPLIAWEPAIPPELLAGLAALGHQPTPEPRTIGSVQAIMLDPASEQWIGAADPRRDGAVVEVG